jgi:hypothetical protein
MQDGTVPQLLVTDRDGLGRRALGASRSGERPDASAKRFPRPLEVSPHLRGPADPGHAWAGAHGRIGRTGYADKPEASELVSRFLGTLLLESQAQPDEQIGIDRSTVFGDVPVSDMNPDRTPETMPDYFQLKMGCSSRSGLSTCSGVARSLACASRSAGPH